MSARRDQMNHSKDLGAVLTRSCDRSARAVSSVGFRLSSLLASARAPCAHRTMSRLTCTACVCSDHHAP